VLAVDADQHAFRAARGTQCLPLHGRVRSPPSIEVVNFVVLRFGVIELLILSRNWDGAGNVSL
jgi:hypothetical protein